MHNIGRLYRLFDCPEPIQCAPSLVLLGAIQTGSVNHQYVDLDLVKDHTTCVMDVLLASTVCLQDRCCDPTGRAKAAFLPCLRQTKSTHLGFTRPVSTSLALFV